VIQRTYRRRRIGDPFSVRHPTVIKREDRPAATILAVHDVEETRDGIEKLLTADGYRVDAARNEADAIERARYRAPDLILVGLGLKPLEVIASAARIRRRAGLSEQVPIVIFCMTMIDDGAEVAIGHNAYVTRPDSFNQLRAFLARLLGVSPRRCNTHTPSPRGPSD
jgi:CheY-like chemotaxis protein